MNLSVIGVGVGRTGTYSLKLALQELGYGPCYHMEEVIRDMPQKLSPWQAAANGSPDWDCIFSGYGSAVDWPTAGFYRELYSAFPDSKFILTVRSPDSWAASFRATINTLLQAKAEAPPHMLEWLEMAEKVIEKTGFKTGSTPERLAEDFNKHIESVKACIPDSQLLTFEVKEGWAPLCNFLHCPSPSTEFPRSNSREEFWEKVKGPNS